MAYEGTITAITTQPVANSANIAYRPVIMVASDSNTTAYPPMVFCDIYCDGTYYRTITSNTPVSKSYDGGTGTYRSGWQFDIQGVCQEYITSLIPGEIKPQYDGDVVATDVTVYDKVTGVYFGMVRVECEFRSSAITGGVMVPDGIAPVQGSIDGAPVAGVGFASNTFDVLNASFQQMEEQDPIDHLSEYLVQQANADIIVPEGYLIYPLSHVPYINIYWEDYGLFPIYTAYEAFDGDDGLGGANFAVCFFDPSDTLVAQYNTGVSLISWHGDGIRYMPIGISNFITDDYPITHTDSTGHGIPFAASVQACKQGGYYRVMAMNPTGNIPIWISPKIFILNPGGLGFEVRDEVVYPFYVPTDHTRIWFRNYLGHLDQVNFRMTEGTTKVTSQPKEKPLVVSPAGLNRNRTGQERMNVRSNDIKTVTGVFKEDQIAWLKELFAGSATFIEFHDGFAGDGGTPVATLIPIVIADAEFVSQKWDDDRYQYEVAVKYMMSNENIIVRN